MKLTSDQTGDLGELIAATDLSRPVKGNFRRPLFKPTHLGGKYAVVDFIVDLLAADATSLGFFFAQVKSTAAGSDPDPRLAVAVLKDHFNQLARLPVPTYLIGVDVMSERSFVVAANRSRRIGVSSITRAHGLRDDKVRIALFREVLAFWKANKPYYPPTRFKDA